MVESSSNRSEYRRRQIDLGKKTPGYLKYSATVNKWQRNRTDPKTPPLTESLPHRHFTSLVREWRRKLHDYDHAALTPSLPRHTTNRYDGNPVTSTPIGHVQNRCQTACARDSDRECESRPERKIYVPGFPQLDCWMKSTIAEAADERDDESGKKYCQDTEIGINTFLEMMKKTVYGVEDLQDLINKVNINEEDLDLCSKDAVMVVPESFKQKSKLKLKVSRGNKCETYSANFDRVLQMTSEELKSKFLTWELRNLSDENAVLHAKENQRLRFQVPAAFVPSLPDMYCKFEYIEDLADIWRDESIPKAFWINILDCEDSNVNSIFEDFSSEGANPLWIYSLFRMYV